MTAPQRVGRRTRVLLADDSEGLRLLMRTWLGSESDLEVVAEATNGAEAVALADAHRPDVVVLDVAMPVMDGLEALTELRQRFPDLPVVMHSGFAESQVAQQATDRGAWGFIEKSGDLEPLVEALRSAARGPIDVRVPDTVIDLTVPAPRAAPMDDEPSQVPPPDIADEAVDDAPGFLPMASPSDGSWLPTVLAVLALLGLAVLGPAGDIPPAPVLLAMSVPVVVIAFRHGQVGGVPAALAATLACAAWALTESTFGPGHVTAALLAYGAVGFGVGDNVDRRRRAERRQQQISHAVVANNRALAQANDQLRLLNVHLQASNDDLRQFGQIAGHDLVEPLRNIRSFSELLQSRYSDELDERGRQYLYFVNDGATRMQALVDDLRAYTRVGQAELRLGPVDLAVVARDAQAALRMRLGETGAQVRVGRLPVVHGDRSLLGLVLQNLVSNAVKFTVAEAPVVDIDAERIGTDWHVHVHDTGIGLDPARADAAFGLFTRLHTSDEYPGTGLGLAITKRIVERHGGSVALAPRPGGGTTATVVLPAERGTA